MCGVCSLCTLFNGFPSASGTFSLPAYHNLRLNPLRSWFCYEHHFLGKTAQAQTFASDSPHPAAPFTFSSLPPTPLCNALLLFWELFLTWETSYRQGSWHLRASQVCVPAQQHRSCRQMNRGWYSSPWGTASLSPHITVSADFSGQSCPGQTRVCIPSSYSPSLTIVACVSLLPFSQFTQPTYLSLLTTWAPISQQQEQLLPKRKSISCPHNFTGTLFPDCSSITPCSF